MRSFIKVFVLLFVLVGLVAMTGCDPMSVVPTQDELDSEALVGSWENQSTSFIHVFESDGTGSRGPITWTWAITGGILTIDATNDMLDYSGTYTLSGDDLSFDGDNYIRQ